MKWFVTGGLGFVGVNLVERILGRGDSCALLDNLSVGSPESLKEMASDQKLPQSVLKSAEVIRGDVTDLPSIVDAIRGCDVAVHLAAHTNVIESVSQPGECFRINAIGTLNVLEAARVSGVDRVILASSNAAAGETSPPIYEEIPPRPVSPYGASKLAAEALASAYSHTYDMHVISLRFSNAYGLFSLHKKSVVALFLRQILLNQPLVLYDGGRPTRDYVHVVDIVQAIEKAVFSGTPGGLYQIGTGEETSTRELVQILARSTGRQLKTSDAPARTGEITRNFSDISKARKELSYAPTVALAEGIGQLWPWFRGKLEATPTFRAGFGSAR